MKYMFDIELAYRHKRPVRCYTAWSHQSLH